MHRLISTASVMLVVMGTVLAGAPAHAAPPVHVLHRQLTSSLSLNSGEPWVARDPRQPNVVLATWTAISDFQAGATPSPASRCGAARSTDGGHTWNPLPDRQIWQHPTGTPGDAFLAVGPDGTFYLGCTLTLSNGKIEIVRSTDEGRTWSAPIEVFGTDRWGAATQQNHRATWAEGRPMIEVDAKTGDVYVTIGYDFPGFGSTVMVSRDHGASWSLPRYVEPDQQATAADVIGVYDGILAEGYLVDPSSSGYRNAQHPAVQCAEPCAVFETSTDFGVSWKRHVVPVADVGGGDGEEGPVGAQIVVAADPTATGSFAMLVSTLEGAGLQIWRTSDSGQSWQQLQTLSAPTGQTFEKYWLAYGPTGALGLVWRTVASDGTYTVSAATSRHGTSSLGPAVLLTATPSAESGVGDDCACNLQLSATTLSTAYGFATASGAYHRQAVWASYPFR